MQLPWHYSSVNHNSYCKLQQVACCEDMVCFVSCRRCRVSILNWFDELQVGCRLSLYYYAKMRYTCFTFTSVHKHVFKVSLFVVHIKFWFGELWLISIDIIKAVLIEHQCNVIALAQYIKYKAMWFSSNSTVNNSK